MCQKASHIHIRIIHPHRHEPSSSQNTTQQTDWTLRPKKQNIGGNGKRPDQCGGGGGGGNGIVSPPTRLLLLYFFVR